MEQNIDIKENYIYQLDANLLAILLLDKSSGKNIIWATDNYAERGFGYQSSDQIMVDSITHRNGSVIKPRTTKSKKEQAIRVRDKAEVFTPSWVCNNQNITKRTLTGYHDNVVNAHYFDDLVNIFSGTKLSAMAAERPKLFQELLPELIKKLILCNSNNVKNIRMPSKDDNWSPGFDGIVESEGSTAYVCAGKSVWEFGANKNFFKKINEDWKKRTQNSLGVAKEETTIYFVSPHIWAYDNKGWPISKWETEHQQEWKGIHIYDANVLSAWINSEPAVCAWLLEQFGETGDIDFLTASSAWERFSSKSSPAFSHSLFLEGRDVEAKNFLEALDSSIIRVKADTTIDSFGFCLSVILKNEDLANTVIVINNQTTYKNLSRFCHDKLFLLNCRLNADDDVIPGISISKVVLPLYLLLVNFDMVIKVLFADAVTFLLILFTAGLV